MGPNHVTGPVCCVVSGYTPLASASAAGAKSRMTVWRYVDVVELFVGGRSGVSQLVSEREREREARGEASIRIEI